MPNSISISETDLELIQAEGEAHFPEECCGFLFGTSAGESRDVIEVHPIRNAQDENRARRFLITPEQFRNAEAYATERGFELIGFYHTHPDHPAVPSDFDREHALPFYSYVILSVRKGAAAELRSWQLELERNGYMEEQVNIKAEITE